MTPRLASTLNIIISRYSSSETLCRFILKLFTSSLCNIVEWNKQRIIISDSSKIEVSASLKLAEICLEKLFFRDVDVICLAIKLLFSNIQQWQSDPLGDENNDKINKADVERLKEDYVRQISEKLVRKLKRELYYDMPDNYQSDALKRELQVWIMIMQWYMYLDPSKWSAVTVSLFVQ